jgi:polyisoprenoid-binding protein YceI
MIRPWLFLVVLLTISARTPVDYKVDTHSSIVVWNGYQVTGKHSGTVKIRGGTIQFTDGVLTGGAFMMDMTSIRCIDLDTEWAVRLVALLKGDDFFSVVKFPTAKFVITGVTRLDSKDRYEITGNLTIKGITDEVVFQANASEQDNKVSATGKMTIDRTHFNIRYGSNTFFDGLGDKAISDEFDLEISLAGAR